MNLPEGPYQIVYADPPWYIDGRQVIAQRVRGKGRKVIHENFNHYNQLTLPDLMNISVNRIVDKNAALFLWTTDAAIPHAVQLFDAWGFKYKTVAFVWVKTGMTGILQHSLRQWTFGNAELCLLGIRGSMIQQRTPGINQLIMHPRMEHSKKLDSIRRLIMKLFPSCSRRIELFARCQVPGWDAWGDEVYGSK